ncbi:MAG TPA: hypothetical protein VGW32_01540, partial [Pyrinomonadaceae bacterium]|nr:hypothetical protein [Pyrinomonadaceae bacterium]
MKIALFGFGAMGRLVGKVAAEKGHEVALTIDIDDASRSIEELTKVLRGCDVAIDFSVAEAIPKNTEISALAGVPLVVGTTGWLAKLDEVRRIVDEFDGA